MTFHRRTTPGPPIDVVQAVSELGGLVRTTVRLHPRRGQADPGASKLGGAISWPVGEPWPVCDSHECPFVSILQLKEADVPELGFPDGTDLFQLLWCPFDHEELTEGPSPLIYWRDSRALASVEPRDPGRPDDPDDLLAIVPMPCVLHPERIVEFPHFRELPRELLATIRESGELNRALGIGMVAEARATGWGEPHDALGLYHGWLSVAQGCKVGGYPNWVQDPSYPPCRCGRAMDHLLTLDSDEFQGIRGRWLAREDLGARTAEREERVAVQNPADWIFGDAGRFYLFICRECRGWPTRHFLQYS